MHSHYKQRRLNDYFAVVLLQVLFLARLRAKREQLRKREQLSHLQTEPDLTASKRKEDTLKGFEDFSLKAKARIWP